MQAPGFMQIHSVGWDKYKSDLTQQHITALRNYDPLAKSNDEAAISNMLNEPQTGTIVCEALAMMLKSNINTDDLKYVLCLIDAMLEGDRARVSLFRSLASVNPFEKLMDVLAWVKDATAVRLATHSLAVLIYPGLGYKCEPYIEKTLLDLVEFVRDSLDDKKLKANGNSKDYVERMIDLTSCLMVFLRETRCRSAIRSFNLHSHLSAFLDAASTVGNVQLLYQVGFCLWLLSYDEEIATAMGETNVVPNILKVMRTISKEKVIRVFLACLRNLIDKAEHNQCMIDNGAQKQIAVLRNRKWSDEEVGEDLDFIYDSLAKSVTVLSSLDMYRKEVQLGKLEWTPVHTSDTFWRDNVMKMCPAGGSVADSNDLMALTQLLHDKFVKWDHNKEPLDSDEALTVAVICHDLGEFARFHPQGKRILQTDNAAHATNRSSKDILMSIMSGPPGGDEEIGKQALTCIHKMMVTNWQFLENRS